MMALFNGPSVLSVTQRSASPILVSVHIAFMVTRMSHVLGSLDCSDTLPVDSMIHCQNIISPYSRKVDFCLPFCRFLFHSPTLLFVHFLES